MKLTAQVLKLNPNIKLRINHDYEFEKNGKIIGVFGKSGCGKTSLLEYLFRHYKKNKIVYMKQDIVFHPELTVYETLWFYTQLRCCEECSHIGTILEKMNMTSLSDYKIGNGLSGGEKKRIMIAYHLLDEQAELFLLDEPFSGIDPMNTELIFSLIREKTKNQQCTILMTIHQVKPLIQEQLDEIWTFVPCTGINNFQLEILPQITQSDSFSDINLDEYSPIIPIPKEPTKFLSQWKYLFLRDRLLDKRNRFLVFLRWTTPLSVVFIQKLLIGSFLEYFYQWTHTEDDTIPLVKSFLLYCILLFTASISPMHMLNDHFHKRVITQHEISQKLYRKNVYFLNAILWDQWTLVLISLCIVLLLVPPTSLFFTLFFNIMMQMIFTNMLMWACSSFSKATFNMTLVFVSTYISIAFIVNIGMFLKSHSVQWIQYTSMTHIQNNLFLEKLFLLFPNKTKQLEFVSSLINTHSRFSFIKCMLFSISLWGILPIFIYLLLVF